MLALGLVTDILEALRASGGVEDGLADLTFGNGEKTLALLMSKDMSISAGTDVGMTGDDMAD